MSKVQGSVQDARKHDTHRHVTILGHCANEGDNAMYNYLELE